MAGFSCDGRENTDLKVDCDFPGGNIILERIEGNDVFVRQDQRGSRDWFYWYFRVLGCKGRDLTFHFHEDWAIGVRGPALSLDGGKTWFWLGKESRGKASFRFAPGEDEARFCFTIPYLEANLREFLGRHRRNPRLEVGALARTRKGRTAELLRLGRLDGDCDHRVMLACRHHCCETMAGYALEGIMDAVLQESEDGGWFRERAEIAVVPFVDKDGVEDGDQGKNRAPHDHGRDYGVDCIYPEVRAIREFVPAWAKAKLRLVMDMHCPWVSGDYNEHAYFVGADDAEDWKELGLFSRILESVRQGPVPYRAANNLPFGKEWNTAEERAGGLKSLHAWCLERPEVAFSCSLELPYANAEGMCVTAESARGFGRDLAKAIRRYLEERGPTGARPRS